MSNKIAMMILVISMICLSGCNKDNVGIIDDNESFNMNDQNISGCNEDNIGIIDDNKSFNVNNQNISKDEIIMLVNNEPLLMKNFKLSQSLFLDFDNTTILKYMIIEELILQQAEQFNVSVHENEVMDKISTVKNMDPAIYDKAIEQYGSEENYSVYIKKSLLYEKIRENVLNSINKEILFNKKAIQNDSNIYMDENGYKKLSKKDIVNINNQIENNYRTSINLMYFENYGYSLLDNADLVFLSDYIKSIYYNDINNNDINNELENILLFETNEITKSEIDYFYESYFNLNSEDINEHFLLSSIEMTPLNNYFQKYISMRFDLTEDNNKYILITFSLDITKTDLSLNSDSNVTINGMSGTLNTFDVFDIDDNTIENVNLTLMDEYLNAIISVDANGINENDVIKFTEHIIKVAYE